MTGLRYAGLAVALLVAVSGCLAGGPLFADTTASPTAVERPTADVTGTPTLTPGPAATGTRDSTGSDDPEPRPLPEPPDDLTAESAVDYAERYAAAATYNRSLADADGDVESVTVDCDGTLVNETAEGYRVRVDCGSITDDDGAGASQHSTVYRVDDDGIAELDVRPVFPGGSPAQQPLPERPDDLTAESAVDYVEHYEVVRAYNASLGDGDAWTEYWRYGCTGTLVNETADGYHVRLTCGGGFHTYDRVYGITGVLYRDVTYRVDETTTTIIATGARNGSVGPPDIPSNGTNSSE